MSDNLITFRIVRRIGVLREIPTGWNKELNIVSWNDNPPKYDIREWDPTHERMTKGITLSESEILALHALLSKEVNNLTENA